MRASFPRFGVLAGATAACALLAACGTRAVDRPPPVEAPAQFSAPAGAGHLPDRWWQDFASAPLDSVVADALAGNFDLRAAWYRLAQAQALARREKAPLFPDLQLDGSARLDDPDPDDQIDLQLGLSSQYELDLWGRLGSAAAAERYRAEASAADYRAAALTLSAEVARNWFAWLEARDQLALLQHQVATNEQVEQLLRNRFGAGAVRGVDLLRQRQLTESTREQEHLARADHRVLRHRLDLLLGRPPGHGPAVPAADSLPGLPPLPATGLPTELLLRRPDVQGALARARAADRDLASALSDRYPRLTLTGSLDSDNSASDLLQDWATSLVAGLFAPLWDGGERGAEVDRQRAALAAATADYGQAILVALQEVEDALAREQQQRLRVASLRRQLELSRRAYEQLQLEYLNGQGDYIDVLTALRERQRLQRDLLSARREQLDLRVALCRALAGGFDARPPDTGAALP